MRRLLIGLGALLGLCLVLSLIGGLLGGGTPASDAPTGTPQPTATARLTALPTDLPTDPPTDRPTDAPSATPTDAPTTAPTETPTTAPTEASTAAPAPLADSGRVVGIVDGDTLDVEIGGQVYRLRYIGIDAQERDQPCGPTATAANRALAEGQTVRLERDVSETDRYDRLLRYVWVGDVMLNAELVKQGYAVAKAYPPDTKHHELLASLQQTAEAQTLGCWAPVAAAVVAPTVAVRSAEAAIDGGFVCPGEPCVKGNISQEKEEKIFHLPACPDYGATRINTAKGERWFASEAEALAAGWRKALNCP